jgi:predicted acetyltransferase
VTTTLRTLTPDDLDGAWEVLSHAFGGPTSPEDTKFEFPLVDPKRFYGTYDGDRMVATGGSFDLAMTVPGGVRPVAGVTWIGVLPTHRRRGLLTELMRHLLDDLHAAGEPLAALWASEGAIYQRFGYGPAMWDLSVSVPSKSGFNRSVSASGMRIVEPQAGLLAEVYDRVAARSIGWYARDEAWWDYRLQDHPHRRSGKSPLRCVVADGPDGITGYALYATSEEWTDGRSAGTVHVREIVAADPETRARVWRYLLDLDLMTTVRGTASVSDPLLHLLAEPRAAKPTLTDNIWVRLVDVPAALADRPYLESVDVVLDVEDAFCPWNAGRFRLTGGPDGASCEPTSDAADLQVHAGDLGAVYLGGTTLHARAAAEHVRELTSGALAAASRAFGSTGAASYCPMVF